MALIFTFFQYVLIQKPFVIFKKESVFERKKIAIYYDIDISLKISGIISEHKNSFLLGAYALPIMSRIHYIPHLFIKKNNAKAPS